MLWALVGEHALFGISLHCCVWQVNDAAEIIYDLVDPKANLIFGAVVDKSLQQEVPPLAGCSARFSVQNRSMCKALFWS